MNRFVISLVVLVLLGAQAMAPAGWGQTYLIDRHTIQPGAGVSSGGGYTLTGAAKWEGTGTAQSGPYSMNAGLGPSLIVTSTVPELPVLTIQQSADRVTISWSPMAPGFGLEMSDSLSSNQWLPVAGESSVALPINANSRFYRLKKKG